MTFTIITENDVSQWDDETGTTYHFPNKYLKHLQPGTKLIYYKGKLKDKQFLESRLSKDPHYFGIAEVGSIWEDENNKKNHFAEIINYSPFSKAVSFKNKNGKYLEEIPKSRASNYWRDGVRPSNLETYNRIISNAGLGNELEAIKYSFQRTLTLVEKDVLKPYSKGAKKISESKNSISRYSSNAKPIGDKGEEYVLNYLKSNLSFSEIKTLKWHADIGETPGYDISYINDQNQLIAIEVKSTSGKVFKNFIMTINEINAAQKLRENYFIYLVADCLGSSPKLNIKTNPTINDSFSFEPLSFNVSLK